MTNSMKIKYSVLKGNIADLTLSWGSEKPFPESALVHLTLKGWCEKCILRKSGGRVGMIWQQEWQDSGFQTYKSGLERIVFEECSLT